MRHMGHYPMLERSDEFNRHVAALVESLTAAGQAAESGVAKASGQVMSVRIAGSLRASP